MPCGGCAPTATSYLCWDPRVKTGSVGCFLRLASFRPVRRGGGSQLGSRWSARSATRPNDLEAGADPPHTRSRGTREKRCGSSHVLSPVGKYGARDAPGNDLGPFQLIGAPFAGKRAYPGGYQVSIPVGVRAIAQRHEETVAAGISAERRLVDTPAAAPHLGQKPP